MEEENNKSYQPINSCTRGLSIPQIISIGIFACIDILVFNLIPRILKLNYTYLYAILGLKYFTFIILLILYIALLVIDPSDIRLKNNNSSDQTLSMSNKVGPASQNDKYCAQCKINAADTSYHCNSCHRCVEEFDHHCAFINNCIGKQNYKLFVKLLVTVLINMGSNMGLSLWLVLECQDASRWIALALGILSFLVFIEIAVLAIFHAYISAILFKRTVEVLAPEKLKSSARIEKQQKNHKSILNSTQKKDNQQSGMDLKTKQITLTKGQEQLNKNNVSKLS